LKGGRMHKGGTLRGIFIVAIFPINRGGGNFCKGMVQKRYPVRELSYIGETHRLVWGKRETRGYPRRKGPGRGKELDLAGP